MMPVISGITLAVSSSLAGSIVAKVTVSTTSGLLAARLARGNRAAVRHALLAAMFGVVLLLPVAAVLMPPVHVGVPVGVISPTTSLPVGMGVGADSSATTVGAGTRVGTLAPHVSKLSLSNVLFAGWAFGVALFLLPVVVGLWQIHSLRRSGLPWRRGQSAVESLSLDEGIHRRVQVLLHEAQPGPMTCGIVRPAIVLPREAENWTPEDLNRAIVHELEHVRRGDSLSCCLARATCALYWFHPLVWIAWRKLVLEAERCCDDAVLRRSEPTAYAEQLVGLAKRLAVARRSPFLAMANRADLATRVGAVLDSRQRRGQAGIFPVALVCGAAAALVLAVSPLTLVGAPQAASENKPSFEVASIKPTGGRGGGWMRPMPGRLTASAPLRVLIEAAYHVQPFQIVGGPEWVKWDGYAVDAKASGNPDPAQMMLMLQSLLGDRFQLRIHRESREMPVYALVPARGGLKLPPQRDGSCVEEEAPPPALGDPAPPPRCGGVDVLPEAGGWHIRGGKVPMAEFVRKLSEVLGRTVTDQTGFSGVFDIDLRFLRDETTDFDTRAGLAQPPPGAIPGDTASPSIFTAIQQVGLRLESTKGPVEVLVIDHVERPSPN